MKKINNKSTHSSQVAGCSGVSLNDIMINYSSNFKILILLAVLFFKLENISLSQEILKTNYGDKTEFSVLSKNETNDSIIKEKNADYFISKSLQLPFKNVTEFTTISFKINSVEIYDEHSIQIRYSRDGNIWIEWKDLHLDYGHRKDEQSDSIVTTELEYIDKKYKYYQFKLTSKITSSNEISLHFFSPTVTNLNNEINNRLSEPFNNAQLTCSCSQPSYTNRSNWSCPTGSSSSWTPVNTTVTHLIVHHSAGSNSSSNWAATVLSIWNQHTYTNGWGDIGYNWLIDPNGVIYEGRASSGSSDPIGAHMCSNNANKMGVCLLGDFTSQQPTYAARQALLKLLAWKSCQKNIDPLGSGSTSSYSGFMSNISGHRDGCSPSYTECPGSAFYTTLSSIRTDVNTYRNNNCGGGGTVCNDNFESNNSTSAATNVFAQALGASNPSNYTLQGNIGYAGDQDFSKVNLSAPGTLTTNLSNLPFDCDLELYGPNGLSQYINGSTNSGTNNETITYNYTGSGTTVYIKVYPYNSSNFTTASCYNLQFVWTPSSVSQCSGPSNLNINSISQTSAQANWIAPISTSSTSLRYRALSSGSFIPVDVTGLTSYTIPNLSCGTNYEVYLISNCNSGGTQSTPTQSFSTSSCNNCTYTLSSTSANFPYTGGNGSFTINATAGNGCNWSVNSGSTSGCSLTNITSISSGTGPYTITYTVSPNSTNNPLICTFTITGNNGYTQDYVVNIAANTTCDATFSQSTINLPNTSGSGSFTVNTGSGCYWSVYNSGCGFLSFSPTSGTGTTVVNYSYTANPNTTSRTCRITLDQNTRSINLIQASTQPSCSTPTNLQSVPNQTTANVSWINGTGTHYSRIKYKKSSELNFLESTLLPSNSTNYQITGLICNASYDWYIHDSCSNGSIIVVPSTLPASFTTSACTPICYGANYLISSNPTANSISLAWQIGDNSTKKVMYKKTTETIYSEQNIPSTTQTTYTLTGLECDKTYNIYIQSMCGTQTFVSNIVTDMTSGCPCNTILNTPIITGDNIKCPNSAASVSIANPQTGVIYRWSNGSSELSTTYTTSGNISLIASLACNTNISATGYFTINNSTINLIATANKYNICAGETVTLNAIGATNYIWNGLLSNSNGANATTLPLNTGIHQFICNGNMGYCLQNDTVRIVVGQKPSVSVNPLNLCEGQIGYLTATGNADTYIWSNGQIGTTIGVNPTTNTNYSVTASKNGCDSTVSTTVQVKPYPIINITASPNDSINAGQTCILSATGANSYNWSNGQNLNLIQVTPSTTTMYTVTGTNIYGTNFSCATTKSITINVSDISTGIRDNKLNDEVKIYPNPASDFINIELKRNSSFSIDIFDELGQIVWREENKNDVVKIPTSNFASGIYLIKIQTENEFGMKKIIINK